MEQLFYAYELLDKAITGMNWNCMLTTLSDGSSVIDHCYVKVRVDLISSQADVFFPSVGKQRCLCRKVRKKNCGLCELSSHRPEIALPGNQGERVSLKVEGARHVSQALRARSEQN